MFVKFAGAMAVILAGGMAGFYFSGLETLRVRDLREFKKALLVLASEIEYLRTPLAEAGANISKRTAEPCARFFAEFAGLISEEGGAAYPMWVKALETHRKKMRLADEDVEVLNGFGKTLGYLDAQMQLNAISFTVDYIDTKVSALTERAEKSKRMYRSLGWLAGALAVVVLW